VGEEDEEDEENEEGNDGESASQTYGPSLQLHLSDGFIKDSDVPANNSHYMPFRQRNQTSDHEGGWHDCVASLVERYASGSKFKTTHHTAEDNCRNEWPLIDPLVVSCIENITTHDYPFWRVRCRVSY
jgi:hypothetical protein